MSCKPEYQRRFVRARLCQTGGRVLHYRGSSLELPLRRRPKQMSVIAIQVGAHENNKAALNFTQNASLCATLLFAHVFLL